MSEPGEPPSINAKTEVSEGKIGEKSASCVPYFDALWFCYSPVHQLQQYYIYGNVDDCTGHWSRLFACLKQKTARYKDETPDPTLGKHPIWQLRTKAEAESFWKDEFVPQKEGSTADGSQQQKQTFV